MKHKFFLPALIGSLMLGFSACSSDDKNDGDQNGAVDVSNMNVEEQKEYVGSVAEEVSEMLSVPEVKGSIEFLNYLSEKYGEFDDDDDYYYSKRISRISRSYELIQFADVTGIYRWNGEEFVRTGDSNDFTGIIPNDPLYGQIVIKVSASNDGDILSFEDYDYDCEETYAYDVKVPHTIQGTVTAGGKTMMTQTVKSSGLNGKNTTASSTVTLGALVIKADGQASPSNATATSTMSVNGVQFASANSSMLGNNLTDRDKWESDLSSEYFYPSDRIKSATANADLLNKIQLKANLKMSRELDNTDNYYEFGYEWSDYPSKSAALSACKRDIENTKDALTGYFTFNNTDKRQAVLTFVPYLDEYYSEYYGYTGYYKAVPAIMFADGSTYSDEMFEGVFNQALKPWEFLFR